MALPVEGLAGGGNPFIAVGGAALGSYIGGMMNNANSMAAAQKQMDFQREMSNTAYQRATNDMRLAGINPALAYMQGGASSPGGAMANVSDTIGPAVSSAMHASRLRGELDNMRANTEKNLADRQYTVDVQAEVGRAQEALLNSQSAKTKQETELIRLGIPRAKFDAEWFGGPAGKNSEALKRLREMVYGGSTPLPRY